MSEWLSKMIDSNIKSTEVEARNFNNDIEELLRLTTANSNPNLNHLVSILRDVPSMKWNLKVHGYLLSKLLLGSTNLSNLPVSDDSFSSAWSATVSKDFFTNWFRNACKSLKIEPVLHRKIWEFSYVLNNLEFYNKISPNLSGLGFGCGTEPLPSFFASKGINVVATDLEPSDVNAKAWINTDQHLSDIEKIWVSDLCTKDEFNKFVTLRYENMNSISKDLSGKFDFCWSICALEHLGSIEKGLEFIKKSLDTLKPGGIAIHTTEFNYTKDEETIDNWPTVLFRKKDFIKLHQELSKDGYELPMMNFSVGDDPVDWFIDLPPYPHDDNFFHRDFKNLPHLKLSVDGFPVTCFGLVIKKPL